MKSFVVVIVNDRNTSY